MSITVEMLAKKVVKNVSSHKPPSKSSVDFGGVAVILVGFARNLL